VPTNDKSVKSVFLDMQSYIYFPDEFFFWRTTALEGQNFFSNGIEQYSANAKTMFD